MSARPRRERCQVCLVALGASGPGVLCSACWRSRDRSNVASYGTGTAESWAARRSREAERDRWRSLVKRVIGALGGIATTDDEARALNDLAASVGQGRPWAE